MKVYITEALRSANLRSSDYNLSKLFINQLREMIWAERLIMKTIPKIVNNISSPNLISIIADHEGDTKEQIKRLEKIFELINVYARGRKSIVVETLINESKSTLESTKQGPVRDAAIIAVVQKIRHYTIAGYRTLVNYGKTFGDIIIVDILNKTLLKQQEIDVFLSDAAYNTINFDAAIDENKFLVSHYEVKKF